MIAVDTNVLVYAHRVDSEWHLAARNAVAGLAEAGRPWAIPWPCVHEFLAITTHARIFKTPTPLADAIRQVEIWCESPMLALLAEEPGYWVKLSALLGQGRITGPAIHDARIAALCLHHGVSELWSADRDFHRLPALAVKNPLIGARS